MFGNCIFLQINQIRIIFISSDEKLKNHHISLEIKTNFVPILTQSYSKTMKVVITKATTGLLATCAITLALFSSCENKTERTNPRRNSRWLATSFRREDSQRLERLQWNNSDSTLARSGWMHSSER